MSGRDFKLFLSSHKSQIGQQDNRLVSRFLSGHGPTYKPVDYNQLALLTQVKRSAGERSRKKVEKLAHISKENKEHATLQEHKRIWINEYEHLLTLVDRTSRELIALRPPTPNFSYATKPLEEIYEDINDYEDFIYYDTEKFITSTVQPVHDLNEDIKIWIKENENKLRMNITSDEETMKIHNVINSVKQQQSHVIKQLNKDRQEIEKELALLLDTSEFNFVELKLPNIELDVPVDMIHFQCPDEELRESCFKEFNDLNEKYHQMLTSVEEKYDGVRFKVPWNWSDEEHIQFIHITSQYANVTRNRRRLFLDRIKREMPQKLKEEVEEYEQWWMRRKTFQSHLKGIFHAWKRDQEDLKLHIETLFNEACDEYEHRQQNINNHIKQKFICNFLHEKLLEYKEEQLELMKLEASNRVEQERKEEEKRYEKEVKDQKKREREKKQILHYKERKFLHSAKQREHDHARMVELQEKQSVLRVHNMERVGYREELLLEKTQQQRRYQLQQEQEEIEKQKRLQRLRDQVEVHVVSDPSRILEPTEAIKHRNAAVCNDDVKDLQQPLFDIHTFTVDQVGQDKRLQIENALRRANIHMTDYARTLISNQPPPSVPRKDTLSTAFRSDFSVMENHQR